MPRTAAPRLPRDVAAGRLDRDREPSGSSSVRVGMGVGSGEGQREIDAGTGSTFRFGFQMRSTLLLASRSCLEAVEVARCREGDFTECPSFAWEVKV